MSTLNEHEAAHFSNNASNNAAQLTSPWAINDGRPAPESIPPTQMTRESLAEELLAQSPQFCTKDIRQAAHVGISPPIGTQAEAALTRRLEVARELLCRDLRHHLQDKPVLDRPGTLADWLKLHCAGLDYEVFFVIYLTSQHRLIEIEPLFRGTLTQTSVYPREVVKGALLRQAAAAALAHNHPLGDPKPSGADMQLTSVLKQALSLVDVKLLDHLVIAGPNWYSFAEHGDL